MGKADITMNKAVYIGQEILDLCKTQMHDFQHGYMQLKYGGKGKSYYKDTGSAVYEIETEDFYRDTAKDVETKFDTSGYSKDANRPLPIRKKI